MATFEGGTRPLPTRHGFWPSLHAMDEARKVVERLDRIEELEERGAEPAELLAELRGLLHEAEAWARVEGGDAADEAVMRLRGALERDVVQV